MKKIVSLVLTFCVVFTLFPAIEVSAADSWLWPCASKTITQSFKSGGKHNGLDIGGTHGKTAIYAAKGGTVVASYSGCTCRSDNNLKSGVLPGGTACRHGKTMGNYVVINHGNGVYTRYMHMYWVGVATVGTVVNQGDIIGYMGSTGNSYGVHLHFEIRTGGTGVSGGAVLNGTAVNVNTNSISYIYTSTPPVHTHSYTYAKESAHPHYDYKSCSCGDIEYTGATNLVASCAQCYPIGSISLRRSFEKTEGTATFYRNDVRNATSYSLALYRNDRLYDTYDMSLDEKQITGLPSGNYTATLTVKNSATGEVRAASCNSFKIADSYIITYNANGGSGEPSADEKIQDTPKTLSSKIPQRTGYVFLGWARSKKATTAEYQPGDSFTKNTSLTLYAVWEPETYTITYNANGGKGELENVTVTYGDTVRMPNTVVRDGYYLKGWAKSASASTVDYKLGIDHEIKENCTLYAVWGSSTWGGDVSTSLKGSGTEEDPYQIATAADLAYLANKVNSQTAAPTYEYYIMTDNIQLGYAENEKWVPIGLCGTSYQYFKGSFDGNGYTISDMYITDAHEGYVGLFGEASGVIKNLTISGAIENISSSSYLYIGAVAASVYGIKLIDLTTNYFSISNIQVSSNQGYVGMMSGRLYGSGLGVEITGCKVNESHINVESGTFDSGMLIGLIGGEKNVYSTSYSISRCEVFSSEDGLFSAGTGTGTGAVCSFGGLVGCIDTTRNYEIKDCIVKAPYLLNGTYNLSYIGGVLGAGNATVKGCTVEFESEDNIDSINAGRTAYVGGIAGKLQGKVQDCIYSGKSISVTGYCVGGITGWIQSSEISKCIANINGGVISDGNMLGSAGGIAGMASNNASNKESTIENTIVIVDEIRADVKGGTTYTPPAAKSGYIVGEDSTKGELTINNAYYNADIEISASAVATIGSTIVEEINTTGTARSTRLLTIPSFLTGNLGFGQYTSLANLEENPDAVWVIKDGELPELYHTCLNDITVSGDIVNGAITVDKTQAVDGEVVTVTATPADGYILNKVYVNGEEAVGTTFVVEGNSVVYATFAEEIPEYEVSITNDENASGTLTNADSAETMLMSVMALSDDADTSIVANDGEEIAVDVIAEADFTVDTLYANGEEIAGTSFILTKDTVVTMDVASISTDISATTNDVEEVGDYFAIVSGSVSGDADGITRYIRYWKADNADTVYTTEVEDGSGDYTAELMNLEAETTYCYQMTEWGEIKTFTTCAAPDDVHYVEGEDPEESGGEDNENEETDDPMIYVSDVKGRAGETVQVTVSLKNNPGILGMQYTLTYDKALSITKIEATDVLEALDFTQPGDLSANPVTLLWDGMEEDSANGMVLKLTFVISEDAEVGCYDITLNPVDVYNENGDVEINIINGKVEVVEYIPGDINGDGNVTARDVTALRKYIVGGYPDNKVVEATLDVDRNGSVTARDVTRLRQFIVGGYGITLK